MNKASNQKFSLGQKVKLVKGEPNWNGEKHSEFGQWIAGPIPVGSTGVISLVKDHYPESRGTDSGPYCIIWDHNPIPKKGYYWCISLNCKYSNIEALDIE